MFLLSIFIPFINSLIVAFFGRFIGLKGTIYVTTFNLLCSSVIACLNLYLTVQGDSQFSHHITLFSYFDIYNISLTYELIFDSLTVIMIFVITIIATIVHIYSTDYLRHDPHLPRFLAYLSLFTFFMLVLVSAANFIQIFLGWEGVGICSYLLINFWFTRIQANKSALKAVFLNRIGDIALILAIAIIYYCCKTFDFHTVFTIIPYFQDFTIPIFNGYAFNPLYMINLLLIIAAFGKSAQLGLHVWLPDAMEGPTPVSALLHAATMVTAGVFLLLRCSFLFEFTPELLTVVMIGGSLTTFFAATTGLLQNDIKRIIAFSTCSQLGYMFVACGLSLYHISFFHLFNHAFFKALLFLAAGSVIHALLDEQDIRKMGGLSYFLPLTFSFFVIASLSLMGFPYLSGFYSKDLILEYLAVRSSDKIVYWLCLSSAILTAAYSTRLLYYVFLNRPNYRRLFNNVQSISDSPNKTQFVLIPLCLMSCISGYAGSDLFTGFGSNIFATSFFILPNHSDPITIEFLSPWEKVLPLVGSLTGVIVMWLAIRSGLNNWLQNVFFVSIYTFLNQKWFFDKIYNFFGFQVLILSFSTIYTIVDKGLLEVFGPTGLYRILTYSSLRTTFYLQSGFLNRYLFIIVLVFIGISISFVLLC